MVTLWNVENRTQRYDAGIVEQYVALAEALDAVREKCLTVSLPAQPPSRDYPPADRGTEDRSCRLRTDGSIPSIGTPSQEATVTLRNLSIRKHLVALGTSVVLVVLSLLVVSGFGQMRRERAIAESTLLRLAAIVAADVATHLDGAWNVADVLASQAVSALSGDKSCTAWLAGTEFLPELSGATVIGLDGISVCGRASDGGSFGPTPFADRAYFEQVLRTNDFVLSGPIEGRPSSKWSVVLVLCCQSI